jgi:hypothetical protein
LALSALGLGGFRGFGGVAKACFIAASKRSSAPGSSTGYLFVEDAAFICPLTLKGLSELGRLTLNCGYAEMLLDMALEAALKVPFGTAKAELVSPLATRRKVDILRKVLPQNPNEVARTEFRIAYNLIEAASGVRNDVLHGQWGFSTDEPGTSVSITGKKLGKERKFSEVTAAADNMARATRHLYLAILIGMGQDPKSVTLPVQFSIGETEPN